MENFLITLTKISKSQQEIHNYFVTGSTIAITQCELHKSGEPHYHIYIQTPLSLSDVLYSVNQFNPPINDHTNDVRQVKSIPATYKYVTKDKRYTPLYHGITAQEVKKIVNRYKNGYKDTTDILKFKNRSIELIRDIDSIRKRTRQLLEEKLDKTLDLIKLFQAIGDEDALHDVKLQFESLLQERYNYLSSDEIYTMYVYSTQDGQVQSKIPSQIPFKESMV